MGSDVLAVDRPVQDHSLIRRAARPQDRHSAPAATSMPGDARSFSGIRCREWLEIEGGVISSLMQQAIPAEAGGDHAMTSHGTIPGQPHLETEAAVPLFAQALRPSRVVPLLSRPCNPVNYRAGTGARCKQQERNRLPVKGEIYSEPSSSIWAG
jgi:hypothetical protein